TVAYFTNLFRRTPRPAPGKPWFDTPSVRRIHAQTSLDPGNRRPAPGPDGWEKWMVKALNDSSFEQVLRLWNYPIQTSHWPACVKASNLSTIHKRGDPTNLGNYRGVCTSSINMNIPFAWLNSLLIAYLARHQILPDCQVATQPGVQGRDLTSFLSQLNARDQAKGFDRLEPEGFYDAIHAYGLPNSIADFDRSAQDNVPYRVKTFYGLTPEFVISGVTKQGGPLSPLKCTLTSSLGNHWLADALRGVGDIVTLRTVQSRLGAPHLPADHIVLPVCMVEAMDDSIIITRSLPSCLTTTEMAERFQSAYGASTNWDKSAL
ncbi:hypothetical protein BDZ89DRAFT_883338, partial [Hymenopellis radicata]